MSEDRDLELIDAEEESFFAAFSVLRRQVVRIAEDFGDRVGRAVEEDVRMRAEQPGFRQVLGGFFVELSNLFTGSLGGKPGDPDDEDHG